MKKPTKQQSKANAAFIAKLATINIGSGKGHKCGLKCPLCGKAGHAVVRVQRVRTSKPAADEQSFSM